MSFKNKHTIRNKPYSNADIQTIVDLLELPEIKDGVAVWKRPANYWVPLISMFSGMRASEICQLYKQDIKIIKDIHCIHVSDAESDQNLNFSASTRYVPIHSTLLSLGFLDYVENCQTDRLFPELKQLRGGYSMGWRWFSRKVAPHLSQEKGKSFYSIRVNVAQQLLNVCQDRMPEIYTLLGKHNPMMPPIDRKYKIIVPPKEIVEKIAYPGVSLERLRSLVIGE